MYLAQRLVVFFAAVALFGVTAPAEAHQTSGRHNKTQNGAGCSLNHSHPPTCYSNNTCVNGASCPTDSICESAFGFSSSHRTASWTNRWNCHGRTFDNRGSWTGLANLFISCDYGYSPYTPQDGDAVMWDGGYEHSATIIGSWKGLSTVVSSKYGCCGEYRHSLSNAVSVYGSDWTVIRLTSGSPIFKQMNRGGREFPSDPGQLNSLRKEMPWYPTVLASEILHKIEKSALIRKAALLSEESRVRLRGVETYIEQIEILSADLQDARHFAPLAAYNRPEDSIDFVTAIEAGKVLATVASEFPQMHEQIRLSLEEIAFSKRGTAGARSAAIYFLSEILSSEEKLALRNTLERWSAEKTEVADGQVDLVRFYTEQFLQ